MSRLALIFCTSFATVLGGCGYLGATGGSTEGASATTSDGTGAEVKSEGTGSPAVVASARSELPGTSATTTGSTSGSTASTTSTAGAPATSPAPSAIVAIGQSSAPQTTTAASLNTKSAASPGCTTKSIALRAGRTDGSRDFFSFPMALEAVPGTQVVSECIKLTGVAGISTFNTSRGGAYSINGGAYVTGVSPIKEGDELRIRLTASTTADAMVDDYAVFDGTYLGGFSVRTANTDRAAQTFRIGPNQTTKQLSDIAGSLRAGDIVEMEPGNYGPTDLTRSGTAAKPIIIRGIGATKPVISGGSFTVHFKSAHNVVLEDVVISGGNDVCARLAAHNVTLRNVLITDCPRHGIMGSDYGNGNNLIDRVEVTRSGSILNNEKFNHAIYIATDRDAFPDAVLRVQHSYLHHFRGVGIKSRAARTELYYNWIDSENHPDSLYTFELIGFDQYPTIDPQNSDVVGNVLIHQGLFGIRLGGDATGASKGHVRLVNNTFLVSPAMTIWEPVIRFYQALDSVFLANNAFVRNDGTTTPMRLFRDDITADGVWVGGRIKIAGTNNFVPASSNLGPADPSELVNTVYGVGGLTNVIPDAVDARLPNGSPLIGTGSSLSAPLPAGYEIANPLTTLGYRAPSVAPVPGSVLSAIPRTAPTSNIGAQ